LEDYLSEKIHLGQFTLQFGIIFREAEKLRKSLQRNREEGKTFFKTSKSEDFRSLIESIRWEVYEGDLLERYWENLNLNEEEIDKMLENLIRESFEKISQEMKIFLD
jgi:hypothetical protein